MNKNATRQKAFKQRMKEKGYKRIELWVIESKVERLKKFCERLNRGLTDE